ncbi:MAG: hypothetical protein M1819_007065 [Sarea resinae]|nr:MAG: hypothetical protein M1819_007065 [Sarea resinae]
MADSMCVDQPAPIVAPVLTPTLAPIFSLPVEILNHIAKQLRPVHLLHFSNTCKTLQNQFSFENGNEVWYSILPPALYTLAERYQNEAELRQAIEARDPAMVARHAEMRGTIRQTLIGRIDEFVSAMSLIPAQETSINPFMHDVRMELWPQYAVTDTQMASPVYQVKNSYTYMLPVTMPHDLPFREGKTLLGGPYDSCFNYRREIIGHLGHRRRCHVCLESKDSKGNRVDAYRWGMLFCGDCLDEYSITLGTVRSFPAAQTVLSRLRHATYPPHSIRSSAQLYKPEVDEHLRALTDYDSSAHLLFAKQRAQALVYAKQEYSRIEKYRRPIRFQIIEVAMQLWEGVDPFPTIYGSVHINGGAPMSIPRPGLPTSDTFAAFRDRFAPTASLPAFLFSLASVFEQPTQLPPMTLSTVPSNTPAAIFLPDPTLALRTVRQCTAVTDDSEYLTRTALAMLTALTTWSVPDYGTTPGAGGTVTSWVNAARAWHLGRLEHELVSGAVVDGLHISRAMRDARLDAPLIRLRYKLGLHSYDELAPTEPLRLADVVVLPSTSHADQPDDTDTDTDTAAADAGDPPAQPAPQAQQHLLAGPPTPTPSAEHSAEHSSSEHDTNPLSPLSPAFRAAVAHRDTRLKAFTRIVRHACARCPVTGLLVNPVGLRGLIEHMRVAHPEAFWEGEFACVT